MSQPRSRFIGMRRIASSPLDSRDETSLPPQSRIFRVFGMEFDPRLRGLDKWRF